MKKILCTLIVVAASLAAKADGDWMTMLGKTADLAGETGIAGFMNRDAPAYITGKFSEEDRPEKKARAANRNGYYDAECKWHGGYFDDNGMFVEGHEVHTLFGMPYGLGQMIMIPVCLVLMYLAIVKGFEPLLLLPIGSAGVSAVPMAARVSNKVALADDPANFILMQAMGPNVSGVIGSAVVAGVLYTLCR